MLTDTKTLIARFERQAHRMGELWERCQGKGWPTAEDNEFTALRDERVPATRTALEAIEAAATAPLLERIAELEASDSEESSTEDWALAILDTKGKRRIVLTNDMIAAILRKESELLPPMFNFVLPKRIRDARLIETAVIRRLAKLGLIDITKLKRSL